MEDWALKYRPQKLDDLVGQDVNRELLANLVAQNKLYGAMIFYGKSGCGKTTTARILVNEMGAEVVELDAASNNGVDDARNIKDIASKLALTGRRKIIIIDEAHMLSKAAWNALLKCIEEPNEKTSFIFCTTEYSSIPITIRGRSQMLKFYSIPKETLKQYAMTILSKENAQLDDACIDLIIRESKCQVRDMLKLLQRAVENKYTTADKMMKALAIPGIRGMGGYLAAVLEGNAKLAIKTLREIEETTDLLEWKTRLESLVREILEDKYGLSELVYDVTMVQKLRNLGKVHSDVEFGKVLDFLLHITKAETAYQMFYILATVGVNNVN